MPGEIQDTGFQMPDVGLDAGFQIPDARWPVRWSVVRRLWSVVSLCLSFSGLSSVVCGLFLTFAPP